MKLKMVSALVTFVAATLLPICSYALTPYSTGTDKEHNTSTTQAFNSNNASRLNSKQIRNIVERSYQYLTLYNIIINAAAPKKVGDNFYWNRCGHRTLLNGPPRKIAIANNDTLFSSCPINVTKEPVILELPAFDSDYVSFSYSGFDHYVNVPASTRQGDFDQPQRILFYSDRTENFKRKRIKGIDRYIKVDGDYVFTMLRVMPHLTEPERFASNAAAMEQIVPVTYSEYTGGTAILLEPFTLPLLSTEAGFESVVEHYLEIMQFVVNQNSFNRRDEMDRALLRALKPLGIIPGQAFDEIPEEKKALFNPQRFLWMFQQVHRESLQYLTDLEEFDKLSAFAFRPKGETTLKATLVSSVVGPIGMPIDEAKYTSIRLPENGVLNAQNDYVIKMSAEELPPANAFWSFTLYDFKQGRFIANERDKYTVGQNSGYQLDENGGIEIHIAAELPTGVPLTNWIPIPREDLDLNLVLRMYEPDLERLETWTPPAAEAVSSTVLSSDAAQPETVPSDTAPEETVLPETMPE